MYTLYHFPLCPLSRLARVLLSEKQLHFKLIEERAWERSPHLSTINPSMELPVLSIESYNICPIYAICEYLEAVDEEISFLSKSHLANAEIRRLFHWFTHNFYNEVTKYLLEEKVISHYTRRGEPKSNVLRIARNNLIYHLDYIEFLLHSRKWLAGDNVSLADIAAATQISTLDYLNDMHWDKHQLTKEWYAVLKSRPSFRPLLNDRIMSFTPPPHYQNLDF